MSYLNYRMIVEREMRVACSTRDSLIPARREYRSQYYPWHFLVQDQFFVLNRNKNDFKSTITDHKSTSFDVSTNLSERLEPIGNET